MNHRTLCILALSGLLAAFGSQPAVSGDFLRDLQTAAVEAGEAEFGHWGPLPKQYNAWTSHSNRLIPVYTFGTLGKGKGIDLESYTGKNSAYRTPDGIKQIYGKIPTHTLNPDAEYCDQTDLAALQRAALAAGRKHVFLVVFDGMDWQTTWAAAIYNRRSVAYREGRGAGTHFQDYTANGTTQYGWMVTTPHNDGTTFDVNTQKVLTPGGTKPGGYNVLKCGPNPWTPGADLYYPIGKALAISDTDGEHAYPDSAATATAMASGVKTYNDSINIDPTGNQVAAVAHDAQEQGMSVGVVTSVPISHATPACAYAHNVNRDDYQDLTRDLVGLKSISHPEKPLPGVDVLIGGAFGDDREKDDGQGANWVPGNAYVTADDLRTIDVRNGGKYVIAARTAGIEAKPQLQAAADQAARDGKRLFGFYGVAATKGNLPFQTANGDFQLTIGASKKAPQYSEADLRENPTLADMAKAALTVLEKNPKGFWMMLEAGDVDWANHDNNLDASIGAVNSGDAAVKVITDWVEQHSNWDESVMIVTADHGHYLILEKPELLTGETAAAGK